MFKLVPQTNRVTNKTSYPDEEVKKIVRAVLKEGAACGVHVTVRHTKGSYAVGWWRPHWFPSKGEDRPQIMVKLPKPGMAISDYHPYQRKREQGKSFPLADWREALVAVVAHEAEHHRGYTQLGEGRGRKRRTGMELRCDLAAYRAWIRWREKLAA